MKKSVRSSDTKLQLMYAGSSIKNVYIKAYIRKHFLMKNIIKFFVGKITHKRMADVVTCTCTKVPRFRHIQSMEPYEISIYIYTILAKNKKLITIVEVHKFRVVL